MLVRNKGLELPVFSRWTSIAWTTEQMRKKADSGVDTFVRRASIKLPGAVSLKGALQAADDALNRVAEYAGIGVVDHQWGLYGGRVPRRVLKYDNWRLESELLPQGYVLVARVANLAPLVQPDNETARWLNEKFVGFYNNPGIAGPKMSNLDANQVGFYRVGEGTALEAKIIDIDPILVR